jgi:hypothetical protein
MQVRVFSITFALLVVSAVSISTAQAPARGGAQTPAPARGGAQAPARGGAAAQTPKVEANLAQVMQGILFPNSNIIFDAQNNDPAAKKEEGQFGNVYTGWLAVENASLAIAESANLLIIPNRQCKNGKPVPLNRADWPRFVQGLRDAAQASYKAAQSKNMDNIVDAAGTLTEACSNCHDVYREKPNQADRCTP